MKPRAGPSVCFRPVLSGESRDTCVVDDDGNGAGNCRECERRDGGVEVSPVNLDSYFHDPNAAPNFAIFNTTLGTIPVLMTPRNHTLADGCEFL